MDEKLIGRWVWIGKAGRIVDVAESAAGRTLLKCDGPNLAARGLRPEWLEFENMAAVNDALMDDTDERIQCDIDTNIRQVVSKLEAVKRLSK